MKYLFVHGTVVTMDSHRRIIEDGAVAVSGTDIVEVGKTEELEPKYNNEYEKIECGKKLVLPGFIDAHSHAGHCLMKSLAYDCKTFWMPIMEHIYHHHTTDDFWYIEGQLAAAERIKSGVTCGVSVISNAQRIDNVNIPVKHGDGYAALGEREVLAIGPSNPPYPRKSRIYKDDKWIECETSFDQLMENTEAAIEKTNHSHDDLIRAFVAPFVLVGSVNPSDPTNPDVAVNLSDQDKKMMKMVREIAKRQNTRIHTEAFGGMIRMAAQSDDALLGPDVHIQHCKGISFDEAKILAETNTSVTSSPSATQLVERCPIPELMGLGANVAITTDGTSPGVSFDLLQAARKTQMLQQGFLNDMFYLPMGKLLEMITIDAAKAIGRENDLGSLEAGKKADIITINMNQSHLTPSFMPVHKLMIYATAQDVDMTMVNGRILMKDRILLSADENEIIEMAEKESRETITRAGCDKYMDVCDTFWGDYRSYNKEVRYAKDMWNH